MPVGIFCFKERVNNNLVIFTIKHLIMKTIFVLFLCFFCFSTVKAQSEEYTEHIAKAEYLYQKIDYSGAAAEYSAAFRSNGWKGYTQDRFNAARAWSMAGVPDSAFFNLFRIAERASFDRLDELTAEKAFTPLHASSRWAELCALVKSNQPTMPELATALERVLMEDQKYRLMADSLFEKFGHNSVETKSWFDAMFLADSLNTVTVKHVLDTYGWLGTKAIGKKGNTALFLVIQHADIKDQEKYLPIMREAVQKGDAEAADLALLEDRVLLRNGKKQIYGSQVYTDPKTGKNCFSPIEDVDHVDERRASVGLGPLSEYAKYFGIIWDAEAIEKNKQMDPGEKLGN